MEKYEPARVIKTESSGKQELPDLSQIKIISSKIDRETKEGKIVIEVEEVPQEIMEKIKGYALENYSSPRGKPTPMSAAFIYGGEYGYQLAKESNQVNLNQNLSDKARDHAKEVEKFYSPTIEAYRLRAKNSFEAGYKSAQEIPDEVVYVQRTGFPPTEMWYGVVNKYGLINQEYFNGEMWVNCEDPKAWLEPTQLKDLLAK